VRPDDGCCIFPIKRHPPHSLFVIPPVPREPAELRPDHGGDTSAQKSFPNGTTKAEITTAG
jgi:hypothetical protein